MTHFLRWSRIALILAALLLPAFNLMLSASQGQSKGAEPAATSKPPSSNSGQEIPTEKIQAPPLATAKPATLVSQAGSMPAAEVKALLVKIHAAEFRVNDLLTDVHPERWKMQAGTLDSFNQSLKTLRDQEAALESWRAQFEQRPDSIYLGFQTYSSIDAVLPRLYGVARSMGEHENSSYGAQFNQAGDQLYDLQQTVGSYVGSLLQSQDQVIAALGNNVAACQRSLTESMRSAPKTVKYMKNSPPIRPSRRSSRHPSSTAATRHGKKKAGEKVNPK